MEAHLIGCEIPQTAVHLGAQCLLERQIGNKSCPFGQEPVPKILGKNL